MKDEDEMHSSDEVDEDHASAAIRCCMGSHRRKNIPKLTTGAEEMSLVKAIKSIYIQLL
jgi:hypothetical protein